MADQLDPRIGRYGGQKPKQTVSGAPVEWPPASVYGLGDDEHYAAGDLFPRPGWQDVVKELEKIVASASKANKAKERHEPKATE